MEFLELVPELLVAGLPVLCLGVFVLGVSSAFFVLLVYDWDLEQVVCELLLVGVGDVFVLLVLLQQVVWLNDASLEDLLDVVAGFLEPWEVLGEFEGWLTLDIDKSDQILLKSQEVVGGLADLN